MDNQHKLIKGYRDLSQEDLNAINVIKQHATTIGDLVTSLKTTPGFDQRWVSIGATELQQGFMALTRAVAQPTTF